MIDVIAALATLGFEIDRTPRADRLQQHRRGFVVRVLRHEFAAKGFGEQRGLTFQIVPAIAVGKLIFSAILLGRLEEQQVGEFGDDGTSLRRL